MIRIWLSPSFPLAAARPSPSHAASPFLPRHNRPAAVASHLISLVFGARLCARWITVFSMVIEVKMRTQ